METLGYCTLKDVTGLILRNKIDETLFTKIPLKIISIIGNDFTVQSTVDPECVAIIDINKIDKSFYCSSQADIFLVPAGMDTYSTYEYNKSAIHKKEQQLEFAHIPGYGCDVNKIGQYTKIYKPLIILASLQKGILDQSVLLTA